jgi:hypothetical protein
VCAFEFTSGIGELFDVQLIPVVSFPFLSGLGRLQEHHMGASADLKFT